MLRGLSRIDILNYEMNELVHDKLSTFLYLAYLTEFINFTIRQAHPRNIKNKQNVRMTKIVSDYSPK